MLAALSRGDDTISSEALNLARADVDRAEALELAARKHVQALSQQSTETDHSAADALVTAIQHHFNGLVPIQVTVGTPDLTQHDAPMVFLTQTKAAVDDGGVLKGGEVEVRYLRSALYSPLLPKDLAAAAKVVGFRTEASKGKASPAPDGLLVDSIKLKCAEVFATTPIIATEPTDADARHWLSKIMGDLGAAAQSAVPSTHRLNEDGFLARVLDATIEQTKVTKGQRSTKVSGAIEVNPPTPSGVSRSGKPVQVDVQFLDRAINRAVDQHQSIASRGLGAPGEIERTIRPITDKSGYPIGQRRVVKIEATFTAATE